VRPHEGVGDKTGGTKFRRAAATGRDEIDIDRRNK